MHLAEAALGVVERAAQKNNNLIFGQRLQHVDAAARKQRGVDFERRIFGGGADQANAAFLDVREEGILLRFVEAVNFVDEDDGARAVLAGAVGIAHDLLDFLDAGEHGGKLDEVGLGDAGNDLGEGGLAGAGRAPEDHRRGVIALDLHAQRLARPDQVLLANEFIERARAHAVGQRARALGGWSLPVGMGANKFTGSFHHRDSAQYSVPRSEITCRPGNCDTGHSGLLLAASYNTMLAATPALSDSTCEACGIARVSSIWRVSSRDSPAPSLPMKIASGRVHETWGNGSSLVRRSCEQTNAARAQKRNQFQQKRSARTASGRPNLPNRAEPSSCKD